MLERRGQMEVEMSEATLSAIALKNFQDIFNASAALARAHCTTRLVSGL